MLLHPFTSKIECKIFQITKIKKTWIQIFMAKHIELAPNYHSQPNWLPINHFLVGFYIYFLHSVYHMINMYGKKRFFEWNKCFLGYTQRHTHTKTHTVTNTSINIFAKFCVGNCIFFEDWLCAPASKSLCYRCVSRAGNLLL